MSEPRKCLYVVWYECDSVWHIAYQGSLWEHALSKLVDSKDKYHGRVMITEEIPLKILDGRYN